MTIETDKPSMCKYDLISGRSYNEKANEFSERGTTKFSASLHNLENGFTYTYYITCTSPTNGWVTNPEEYVISFSLANETFPIIESINGVMSDQHVVSILGNNFGEKNPAAPIIWDTFEEGEEGIYLSNLSQWVHNVNRGPIYSNNYSYSGEFSASNTISAANDRLRSFWTAHKTFEPSEQVYTSYMYRAEPSPSGPKYSVLKMARLTSNYEGPVFFTPHYNGPGGTAIPGVESFLYISNLCQVDSRISGIDLCKVPFP